MKLHRSLAIMSALLLAASLSAFASVAGTFDRSFTVNGPVDLEVLTHSGDIIVRNGGGNTVTIHARIHVGYSLFSSDRRAEVEELQRNPPVHQSGNSIRIDYVNTNNISIDYEITTPAETKLRGHSGSGNQAVEGLSGAIDLETGSGDVKLDRLSGEVHTQSGSGNLRAHDISGTLRARAGSGDIEVDQRGSGNVDARTGSGNIHVQGLSAGFRGDAGSGDITAEGLPKNDWEVRTGSGNVTLKIPSNAAFDVDLSTGSGSLDVAHPVSTTVQGRVQEYHKRVAGKVNGGGAHVLVHTGSGDVRIQ